MIRSGVRPGRNDTILQPSFHKVGVESWTFNAPCVRSLYFLAKASVSVAKAGVSMAKASVSMAKAGVFPWPKQVFALPR
jgi:hypothetical protein